MSTAPEDGEEYVEAQETPETAVLEEIIMPD